MNCSEVMELIQRQLDDDLDQSEHGLLTEHLLACSACAEVFERLTLLNEGLEQLPKVMPKMSLVDAIMPQLDEIDRLSALKLSTDNDNQHRFTTTDVSGDRAPIANDDQSERKQEPTGIQAPIVRTRWLNRFNWRTASAVVAAGLVFGLFMVNYDGAQVQEQADFAELSSTKEDKTVTSEKQEFSVQDQNSDNLADKPAPVHVPEEDSKVVDSPEQDTSAAKQEASIPVAPKQEQPVKTEKDLSAQSEGARSAGAVGETESPASPPKAAKAPDVKQAPAATDNKAVPTPLVAPLPDEQERDLRSSFAVALQELEVASQDGKYATVWKEDTLTLYALEGDKRTSIQTMEWKYRVLDLRWSADSKQFTVEYVNEAGEPMSDVFVINGNAMQLNPKSNASESKQREGENSGDSVAEQLPVIPSVDLKQP